MHEMLIIKIVVGGHNGSVIATVPAEVQAIHHSEAMASKTCGAEVA